MHKNHLIGCGIAIAVALVVVALSGGSGGSLGVLVAALLCPVTMVVAMRFLMGGEQRPHRGEGPGPTPGNR